MRLIKNGKPSRLASRSGRAWQQNTAAAPADTTHYSPIVDIFFHGTTTAPGRGCPPSGRTMGISVDLSTAVSPFWLASGGKTEQADTD